MVELDREDVKGTWKSAPQFYTYQQPNATNKISMFTVTQTKSEPGLDLLYLRIFINKVVKLAATAAAPNAFIGEQLQ